MKIRAAVSRVPGDHLSIEQLTLDELRYGEVRVKIVATGICHTDYSVMQGDIVPPVKLPVVLGHEGAGIVEAVADDVSTVQVGDHVVMSIKGCGQCIPCHHGTPGYCDNAYAGNYSGGRYDGSATLWDAKGEAVGGQFFGQSSFATHAIASSENVVKIDKELPLELMGPMGCGLQTGAGTVMNVIKPRPGSSLAVAGVGTVGLAAVMAANIAGCDPIIAIDRRIERLEMAGELGATQLIDANEGNLTAALLSVGRVDAAIDTTAVPQVMQDCFEALRMGGTMVVLGAGPAATTLTFPLGSVLMGRTLRGSIQGDSLPKEIIPTLIHLYEVGWFPFDTFVKRYSLDDIDQAIHDSMVTGETIKAVITM